MAPRACRIFRGTAFGLATRISGKPSPQALYRQSVAGLQVEAIPIDYDAAAWHRRFLAQWPPGSDAHRFVFRPHRAWSALTRSRRPCAARRRSPHEEIAAFRFRRNRRARRGIFLPRCRAVFQPGVLSAPARGTLCRGYSAW